MCNEGKKWTNSKTHLYLVFTNHVWRFFSEIERLPGFLWEFEVSNTFLPQNFPDVYSWAHVVIKTSPSSSKRGVIEKGGSIYKLSFSWDFGVGKRRLRRERRTICFIPKRHLLPKSCLSDATLSCMSKMSCKAISGAMDLPLQSTLSQQVSRCHCGSKFPQQGGSSYLSPAILSEGKLRPHGGALDLEEMGVFSTELLLFFQSFLTFWRGAWGCVILSNQITFVCWRSISKSVLRP